MEAANAAESSHRQVGLGYGAVPDLMLHHQEASSSGHLDLRASAISAGRELDAAGGDDAFEDASSQPPGTPASVASGRVEYTGTFFTALKRDFGLEDGDDEAELGTAGPSVRASLRSSQLNPMQSPDASDDEAEDVERDEYMSAYDDGGGMGGSMADMLSDYGNPMMTPQESMMPSAEVSQASLMSVIRDLYQPQPEAPPPAPSEAEGPSRPKTAATEVGRPESVSGPALDADDREEAETRDAMRAVDAMLEEQERRRSELGDYMKELQSRLDEEGDKLIEMPSNYLAMVESLIRQQRAVYTTLQGWLGPRRFEDLPINNLPEHHSDPKVEEGLYRIKELDEKLQEKTLEAIIVNRETFPEKWAEQERRRMELHTKRVEEALKKERMKRLRAARLARAVTSLDGGASVRSSTASTVLSQDSSSSGTYNPQSKYFQLRPEEEELVEAVLARPDTEEVNPFEISLSIIPEEGEDATPTQRAAPDAASDEAQARPGSALSSQGEGTGAGTSGTSSRPVSARPASGLPLAVINARLEEYAQDHMWDAQGMLADFSALSNVAAQTAGKPPLGKESIVAAPSVRAPAAVSAVPTAVRPGSPGGRSTRSGGTSTHTVNGKRDYLREERENKELVEREKDIDARIRAFKTADPMVRLAPDQLQRLIDECRLLEDMHQQRLQQRQEEKERRQKQKEQQQLQRQASGSKKSSQPDAAAKRSGTGSKRASGSGAAGSMPPTPTGGAAPSSVVVPIVGGPNAGRRAVSGTARGPSPSGGTSRSVTATSNGQVPPSAGAPAGSSRPTSASSVSSRQGEGAGGSGQKSAPPPKSPISQRSTLRAGSAGRASAGSTSGGMEGSTPTRARPSSSEAALS